MSMKINNLVFGGMPKIKVQTMHNLNRKVLVVLSLMMYSLAFASELWLGVNEVKR